MQIPSPEPDLLFAFARFKDFLVAGVIHLVSMNIQSTNAVCGYCLGTSALPKFPAVCMRSLGGSVDRAALPGGGGGLPIIVSLSQFGSISESASRSHEDYS